jgi:hypothetical protein
MVKDRIGNGLAVGDKLSVMLPEAQIFGFVAEVKELGLVSGLKRGGVESIHGRVLVSCVIALPVDPESGMVAQVVKVYDADKHPADEPKLVRAN